jgi:hypothetical protein
MDTNAPGRPAMDRYEYPLGVTFVASTPERAAAQAFGGGESDYFVTEYLGGGGYYLDVFTADGEHVGNIPIVR